MGRRKSHHEVGDEGGGRKVRRKVTEGKLSKSKHASDDESGESGGGVQKRSKGLKKEHKRKRGTSNNDIRKRRHRHKSQGSHGVYKSSSKQKTHERFSRWKNHEGVNTYHSSSGNSDSSRSFSSSDNSSCRSSDDSSCSSSRSKRRSRKRSRVHCAEGTEVVHTVGKDYRKRTSSSEEKYKQRRNVRLKTLKEGDRHGAYQNTVKVRSETQNQGNDCMQGVASLKGEGRNSKHTDGKGPEISVSRTIEQEKGQLKNDLAVEEARLEDGAIKAELLEIQLRQKALANLMKHLDNGDERNEHGEIPKVSGHTDDATKGEVIVVETTAMKTNQEKKNGRKETEKYADMVSHFSVLGDEVDLQDSVVDEDRWPLASDIFLQRESLEPHAHTVEDNTSGRLECINLVNAAGSQVGIDGSLEKGKRSTSNVVQTSKNRDLQHGRSQLQVETEVSFEKGNRIRNAVENDKSRGLHTDVGVSGEENNSEMTNCTSEVVKAGDLQVEVEGSSEKGKILTSNAVQHAESLDLQYGRPHSHLETEVSFEKVNRGASDIIEDSKSRELQRDVGVSREENASKMNHDDASKAAAATSASENSQLEKVSHDLPKECSGVNSEFVPKPEKAAGKQEDGASMFQQKTMSVMRGGELVQVNYKVYIPQRAAELAKRRLQR